MTGFEDRLREHTDGWDVSLPAAQQVSVTLPPPIVSLMTRVARDLSLTRTDLLRDAIREHLLRVCPPQYADSVPSDRDAYRAYTGTRLRRDPIRSWEERRG